MAEGDSVDGPRWPLPITVDEPKKGLVFVTLSADEMTVSKPAFGNAKAENADIQTDFKKDEVTVDIRVPDKSGKQIHYQYKKKLPEDIDPDASKINILKDKEKSHINPKLHKGRIRVELKKAVDVDWTPHWKYLMRREKE